MAAERWRGVLVPEAQKQLMELSKNKGMYDVHRSFVDRAEVDGLEGRWEINLSERLCSCRKWQVLGMPCNHAAAVISNMRNVRWEDYVDECYTVARHKAAYALPIFPLTDKSMWESQSLQYTVKPPRCIRPLGRPRKKRIRPHDEEARSTKVRRIHRCARCGGLGHHRKTCKNPPTQSSSGQSSDGPSTEASSSQRRLPSRPRGACRAAGKAVRGREVAGLNPHGGMHTVGRGSTRGYCDGNPVMGGPGRGYGSGMFSYGSGDRARGFLGLRGRRPPRSS